MVAKKNKLEKYKAKIIAEIQNKAWFTAEELVEKLHIKYADVQRVIAKLRSEGWSIQATNSIPYRRRMHISPVYTGRKKR